MRINSISAQNYPTQNFSGLWGKARYSHTERLYGGEYECDYFEKPYYPCKDETQEQIDKAIKNKRKELDKKNNEGTQSAMGYHIYTVIGAPLKQTIDQIEKLKKDCKLIAENNLPELADDEI